MRRRRKRKKKRRRRKGKREERRRWGRRETDLTERGREEGGSQKVELLDALRQLVRHTRGIGTT